MKKYQERKKLRFKVQKEEEVKGKNRDQRENGQTFIKERQKGKRIREFTFQRVLASDDEKH